MAAAMAFAQYTLAQQTQPTSDRSENPDLTPEQQALAEDFYRAEFIILERRIDPAEVEEKMAGRLPEPPESNPGAVLRHTDETGKTRTTLKLVPQKDLHLSSAAKRLADSGRYRVLLAEGWYQAFPPDFKSKPLWVTVGDWLPSAGHTDVQGMISIDRQRYLHVDVQLNHWLPKMPTDNLLGLDLNAETPTRPHPPQVAIEPALTQGAPDSQGVQPSADSGGTREPTADAETDPSLVAGLNWPRAELLTWISETRRMRSEEVHFLDSPTLGVLIFFKKIEPKDAAPLILKLGLTGKEEPQEKPKTRPESCAPRTFPHQWPIQCRPW
jgi:hypothetical protein